MGSSAEVAGLGLSVRRESRAECRLAPLTCETEWCVQQTGRCVSLRPGAWPWSPRPRRPLSHAGHVPTCMVNRGQEGNSKPWPLLGS